MLPSCVYINNEGTSDIRWPTTDMGGQMDEPMYVDDGTRKYRDIDVSFNLTLGGIECFINFNTLESGKYSRQGKKIVEDIRIDLAAGKNNIRFKSYLNDCHVLKNIPRNRNNFYNYCAIYRSIYKECKIPTVVMD